MSKPTRVAAFYLAMVFAAGALFGLLAHRLYVQRGTQAAAVTAPRDPREYRERYVNRLQKDLGLTTEQVSQVSAILDQTGHRFRELRERMDPEFDGIRKQQRERIMGVLTPEQLPKYQKVLEEQRRWRERGGHGRK